MKRVYEELFIVRPDATDEEIDPLVEQVTNYIAGRGGNVDKSEKWGVRKLAYRVQKHNEGNYVLLHFTAEPDTVKEVERRLRVSDLVLKFITVRIDQKMKKVEKRRKACGGTFGPASRNSCCLRKYAGRTGSQARRSSAS